MASFTTLPSEIRLQIITWALHASRNDEERAHAGGDIGFAGVADKRTALSLARLDRRTRSELGETLKKYNARVIVQEIDEQLEHLHNAELQIRRVTGQASFAPQEKLCLHCSISRDSPLCMQQYVVHMAAEEVEAAAQALARKLIAMSFIETMTRGEGNHLTTEFLLGAETPPVEVNIYAQRGPPLAHNMLVSKDHLWRVTFKKNNLHDTMMGG
ncbi:MAG: hypothetical protein M1828_007212 [Chrysothrix sp. TS-e1954]|nr:MAG: hypothetical protein M1828_007212 [Chrysothrix sp. TS-e1954]